MTMDLFASLLKSMSTLQSAVSPEYVKAILASPLVALKSSLACTLVGVTSTEYVPSTP